MHLWVLLEQASCHTYEYQAPSSFKRIIHYPQWIRCSLDEKGYECCCEYFPDYLNCWGITFVLILIVYAIVSMFSVSVCLCCLFFSFSFSVFVFFSCFFQGRGQAIFKVLIEVVCRYCWIQFASPQMQQIVSTVSCIRFHCSMYF